MKINTVEADYVSADRVPVDQMLNDIRYFRPDELAANDPYVPSEFALAMVTFIKMVNGEDGEENETPLIHYRMLDTLVTGERRIANLCFRGSGKTTVMAEYLILYLAVYGHLPSFGSVDLMIYVSDSIENGVKNLRKNLEFRWENSEFLKEYIPGVRFTDIRYQFDNIDGKRLIVKAYGAKTGVRGTKEMGKRPQIAILDDLISDEDARSETIIKAVEDTVYKAVEYALHPKRKMTIWSGTPFNARDPLYKAVESGAWATNVFPVCEKFPCPEKDFRSAWPDRFDFSYVLDQHSSALKAGKVETFDQELMLRIMSEEDRMIPDHCLLWYSYKQLMRAVRNFNFYITTDLSTSGKDAADYSVISVWAYNSNGDYYWVDGACRKQGMNDNIDTLFALVQEYRPLSVGIEVSGQQKAFIDWIQGEMMRRGIFFSFASDKTSGEPGLRPVVDKLARFILFEPQFKMLKVFWPAEKRESLEMRECMNELRLISKSAIRSKNDDFIDSISQLAAMTLWKPSQSADDEDGGYLDNDRYWSFPDDPSFDNNNDEGSLSSYLP